MIALDLGNQQAKIGLKIEMQIQEGFSLFKKENKQFQIFKKKP